MSAIPASTAQLSLSEAVKSAYIYAYPLVLMDITRQVSTNVVKANSSDPRDAGKAPMNQFSLSREFVDASQTAVVRPNADTLYCLAWLDLKDEPLVMSVGTFGDVYYMLPLVNGWTNVYQASPHGCSIGTANGNTAAGHFALCGPGFKGDLPASLSRVNIVTNLVWLLGRVECHGDTGDLSNAYDYKNIWKLQDTLKLTPLSAWLTDPDGYQPPDGTVDPGIDMVTTPPEQVANLTNTNCSAFFTKFCSLIANNPPDPDNPVMAQILAGLGLSADASINWQDSMSPEDFATAQAAAEAALQLITDPASQIPASGVASDASADQRDSGNNNWSMLTGDKIANFGKDYFYRALIANKGLGANLAVDAIYPSCFVDSEGNQLVNTNTYTITFDPGQTPPVKGFWSITAYNAEGYFIDNVNNTYALHNWDDLIFEENGSLVITLCRIEPGVKFHSKNILPLGNFDAEVGDVNLTMRMYWPDLSKINTEAGVTPWKPPAVVKQNT